VNLRSLTRGDAAVAVGALLLLISSFLPLYGVTSDVECEDNCSVNTWHSGFLVILASVVLAGILAAVLILLARLQGEAAQSRHIAGLKLGQWGIALAAFSAWSCLWMLFDSGDGYASAAEPSSSGKDLSDLVGHGFGAYLAFLAVLVIAGAAAATPLVPALQAPLAVSRPAAPTSPTPPGFQQGYPAGGGYPGGYPGGPQQGVPPQGGPQPGGYGYPDAAQPGGAQQAWAGPGMAQPGMTQPGLAQQQEPSYGGQPTGAPAAPAADFAPFWFAVPSPRQLAAEDNPAGPAVGELLPGTWYLAVEQRGSALVAQLQDGRRGLLNDTAGIQRG
jgi:hypothetical protein